MIEAIIRIGKSNLEDIEHIRCDFVAETSFFSEIGINANAEDDLHAIVYVDGLPVGICSATQMGIGYLIYELYVKECKRGQYLGDLLVKMIINKAFLISNATVYVNSENHYKSFFEKIGFECLHEVGCAGVYNMYITSDRVHKRCKIQ